MGDALIGLGVLLAVLGPLLLIPVVWALGRWVARPLLGARPPVYGYVAAAAVVLAALVASYLPGKARFDRLCSAEGAPVVAERVLVDGFYRTKLFPYEAEIYLRKGGFAYVEAPDPYEQGVVVRYALGADDSLLSERVPAATSVYGVEESFSDEGGVTVTRKRVFDRASGRELARAAMIHYSGGPLWLLLGTYFSASCPDIRTAEGSERFDVFYGLETRVLRGQ